MFQISELGNGRSSSRFSFHCVSGKEPECQSKLKPSASNTTKPNLLWCQFIKNGSDEDNIPPMYTFRVDSGLFGAEFMSL